MFTVVLNIKTYIDTEMWIILSVLRVCVTLFEKNLVNQQRINVSILQISCVLCAVFGVIMYRIIVVSVLYASDEDVVQQNAKITTTATAALINLVLIVLLNRVRIQVSV